ncbi:MAG: iron-containing alcohol dehydrogenase [Thermodesulfobacteriota bacterium]|nr:iron-containing alcohol dehydrogenase [Thermodesulfobacteriota bacterium]
MIPSYYTFVHKSKLINGKLALEQIPPALDQVSARNPLLITDATTSRSMLKTVASAFARTANPITVYDRVPAAVDESVIREIADVYHETASNAILALGGNTVIDTAKGVNVAVSQPGVNFADIQGYDTISGPLRPFFAIPTMVQARACINMSMKVASGTQAYAMLSPMLMPSAAVVDPRMMLPGSRLAIAAGIAATLFRAVESATGPQQNPVSKAFAYCALDLLKDDLGKVLKNNGEGALLAGITSANVLADVALSNTTQGLGFAIARAVTGGGATPGDAAVGMMLPELMKYRIENNGSVDTTARLLLALVGPDQYSETPADKRPEAALEAVGAFIRRIQKAGGKELTMAGMGVESRLDEIAGAVVDNTDRLGGETVSREQVMTILKSA